MFSVQKLPSNSNVSFCVAYQLPKQEQKKLIVNTETPKEAALECAQLAFDVMRIHLEHLVETIDSIKPHYFDSTSTPFIRNSYFFCNAYWRFLGLTEKLKSMYSNPLEYSKLIQKKLPEMYGLIPDLVDLKRFEIREQIQLLEKIAGQVETYILRYQNHSILKIAV